MLFKFYIISLISLIFSGLIVLLAQKKQWFLFQHDVVGVQKFHHNPTPHIGGFSVFSSFSLGYFLVPDLQEVLLPLLLVALPVVIIGLIEDFTEKTPPFWRLLFIFFSIGASFFYLNIGIYMLGFEWTDYFLSNYIVISFLFTLLVVGGLINAINIIDGYNGLMAGYSVLALLAISYIAYTLGDDLIMRLSFILVASLFGFFILNFPFGKIFMGDGGAYFVGLILAIIGLMLVERHEELSNWFILLIFIYPMYELLYSIYRRKIIHDTDASQPDANHLHSLVFRRLISCDRFKNNKVICNSMTAPVMWLLSLVGIVPAIVWFDNQTMLIISAFVFMFIYTVIYKYISSNHFKFNQ